MFSGNLACACDIQALIKVTDKLNSATVERINSTQELVMVNDFSRETNENLFRKCLQDRISDISSWRWVLEDLTKRLDESIPALKYELKAIRVVVERLKSKIHEQTSNGSRPGALCPATDAVEEAIKEEYNFLREQKKTFSSLVEVIEKHISILEKTKVRIKDDILNKEETLEIEENCAEINSENFGKISFDKKKKKNKPTTLSHWENRCKALKRDGLNALGKGVIIRQQVRGARVQLTIASQALANNVDSLLRKRMHINQTKLQELDWQRKEAVRDLQALNDEMTSTEQSLLANMEQERVVGAMLADRSQRPTGELTRDEVNKKLKNELARVRRFIRDLRKNYEQITSLQNHLKDTLVQMDCVAEDIILVLRVDEERMKARLGEAFEEENKPAAPSPSLSAKLSLSLSATQQQELKTIKEEDENDEYADDDEDDYPFDD